MDIDPIQAAITFSNLAKKDANEYTDGALVEAKGYTDSAIAALPKGVVYKGAVSYFTDLPSTGQKVGDCYTVKYKGTSGTVIDGTEYVWGIYENVEQWISLGKEISITFDNSTLVINA